MKLFVLSLALFFGLISSGVMGGSCSCDDSSSQVTSSCHTEHTNTSEKSESKNHCDQCCYSCGYCHQIALNVNTVFFIQPFVNISLTFSITQPPLQNFSNYIDRPPIS